MKLLRFPRRRFRWLRSPIVQLAAGVVVMVGGAWLISLWMVGIVLMLTGLGLGADAVLRDTGDSPQQRLHSHEDVLDRYRRAR